MRKLRERFPFWGKAKPAVLPPEALPRKPSDVQVEPPVLEPACVLVVTLAPTARHACPCWAQGGLRPLPRHNLHAIVSPVGGSTWQCDRQGNEGLGTSCRS